MPVTCWSPGASGVAVVAGAAGPETLAQSAANPDAVEPAVDVAAVTKRFGDVIALHEVSMRVTPGTVHGLLGPNGAGTTTLLRLLFGLGRPGSGCVQILGRSPADAVARPSGGVAGFVQAPRFYPYLSARANLELLASYDGPSDDAAERIDLRLAAVGLAGRRRQKVGTSPPVCDSGSDSPPRCCGLRRC